MARIEISVTDEGFVSDLSFSRQRDSDGEFTGFWILSQEEGADWPPSIGDSYEIKLPDKVVAKMLMSMLGWEIDEEEAKKILDSPYMYRVIRREDEEEGEEE